MKKVIFLLGILVSVANLNAQDIFQKSKFQDTIRINCKKIDIELLYKYNPRSNKDSTTSVYENNTVQFIKWVKEALQKQKTEIDSFGNVDITYSSEIFEALTIKNIEPVKKYVLYPNLEGRSSTIRFINRDAIKLTVHFSNVEDVINFDFAKVFSELAKQDIKTHWYPELFEFTYFNDKISQVFKTREATDTYLSSIDVLTGLTLLKQKPTIDFGIGIKLGIEKEALRSINLRKEFSLGYKYLTYYDESAKTMRLNGFLNAMYTINIPRTSRWVGLEAGYLLHRQGDLFDRNTAMVGLVFIGGKIDFSPRLYFSKNDVFPGFSVVFTGW